MHKFSKGISGETISNKFPKNSPPVLHTEIMQKQHTLHIISIRNKSRVFLQLSNIYIYIHIYINIIYIHKKNQLYCMWPLWTSKNHIFFHADIFRNCIPSSVYVCVKDTCWKFSICYKFTIKELLKLSKGITWRYSNIVLKLEKMKFTNPLKNNVQLREEINGTKGTKQLQNKKQTLNITRLAYHNW